MRGKHRRLRRAAVPHRLAGIIRTSPGCRGGGNAVPTSLKGTRYGYPGKFRATMMECHGGGKSVEKASYPALGTHWHLRRC